MIENYQKGGKMSLQWDDKRYLSSEGYEDDFDTDAYADWDKEMEHSIGKNQKRQLIKKKLEERLERKKLRYDINDYDEDLEDFDWERYDK